MSPLGRLPLACWLALAATLLAVAAIALSGALALALSGCNMWMDVETQRPYDPSDGVSLTVGDLQLRNVLLDAKGDAGTALGHRALPTTLFFDAEGRLVDTRLGELSEASLAERLANLPPSGPKK